MASFAICGFEDRPAGKTGLSTLTTNPFLAKQYVKISGRRLYEDSGQQRLYWIDLENLEVSQVRFKADASETGVFDLCAGSDGSVLFSMTFLNSEGAASGWVKLRRLDPTSMAVTAVGGVRMDTVVSASGDRRFAAVAEGNISSGPLRVYDFGEQKLRDVTATNAFN